MSSFLPPKINSIFFHQNPLWAIKRPSKEFYIIVKSSPKFSKILLILHKSTKNYVKMISGLKINYFFVSYSIISPIYTCLQNQLKIIKLLFQDLKSCVIAFSSRIKFVFFFKNQYDFLPPKTSCVIKRPLKKFDIIPKIYLNFLWYFLKKYQKYCKNYVGPWNRLSFFPLV